MRDLGKRLFLKLVLAIIFIVAAAVFSESYAKAGTIDCDEFESGQNGLKKSQEVKTFTRKYWQIVEERAKTYPTALQEKGVVLGDMHFANLGLYYDLNEQRTNIVVNDLDDAGENYIVGDILKFLVYLKTLKTDFNNQSILEAYEKGLTGNSIDEYPLDLFKKMQSKNKKAMQNFQHFLDKKSQEGRDFAKNNNDYERSMLKKLETAQLEPLQLKAILSWAYQETSGSSKGMDRFVFLVKNADISQNSEENIEGILEFKKLKCSASVDLDHQDVAANFQKVSAYLRKALGISVESYQKNQTVIWLDDSFYLRRYKFPNLINDLNITSEPKVVQQDYAELFARFLGLVHSSEVDPNYMAEIKNSNKFLRDEAKEIGKEFFVH